MENRRQAYWDNAKGVLVLLVVLGHILEKTALKVPESNYLWSVIYSFHMPAFIMIGAYLAGRSARNPVERIPKFLFLYILVQYFVHVSYYLLGIRKSWGGDLSTPVKGAWYLLFMIYLNILLCFLRKDLKKVPALILAVALGLLAGFDPTITNEAGIARFITFMPFIILGYAWNLPLILGKMRKTRIVWVLLSLMIIAMMMLLQYKGIFPRRILTGKASYKKIYPDMIWCGALVRLIWYFASTCLALTVLCLISPRRGVMTVIGAESLWIYLAHIAIITAVYTKADEMIYFENVYIDVLAKAGVTLIIIILFTVLVICIKNVIKRYRKR